MTWSLHIARFDRRVASIGMAIARAGACPSAPDYAWLCFTPASI